MAHPDWHDSYPPSNLKSKKKLMLNQNKSLYRPKFEKVKKKFFTK